MSHCCIIVLRVLSPSPVYHHMLHCDITMIHCLLTILHFATKTLHRIITTLHFDITVLHVKHLMSVFHHANTTLHFVTTVLCGAITMFNCEMTILYSITLHCDIRKLYCALASHTMTSHCSTVSSLM